MSRSFGIERLRALKKLLIAIALVVLAVVALAAGMLFAELRLTLRERELVRNARDAGRALATVADRERLLQAGSSPFGGDFDHMARRLVTPDSEVVYLDLIDADGEIVWSSEPQDEDRRWQGGRPASFLAGSRQRTRVPGVSEDEPDVFLEMVTAVGSDPGRGAVVLGLSEARLAARLARGFWQTLGYLAGGALALLGIVVVLYRVLASRRGEVIRQQARKEHLAELGLLAAGLAHELRNRLNALRFALGSLQHRAERVQEPALGGDIAEIAREMTEEVAGVNQIVTSFLAYARPQAEPLEDVEVEAICRQALEAVAPDLADKKIACRLALPREPLAAHINPVRLRQVLVNLLLNASQACREGDTITLRGRAAGAFAVIEVEDDGPGVPPSLESTLFEPFATGRADGTGLGLAISRRLVQEMSGGLSYERRAGGGSCFAVSIPLRAAGRPAGRRAAATGLEPAMPEGR